MNIGIIAYNAACNFGANLQLLSTVEYLKKAGHKGYVINWVPNSMEIGYRKSIKPEQYKIHEDFRNRYYNETPLCRTAKDVASVINNLGIDAVIIGSDAVAQHHPLLSRINFPSRHLIIHKSEDAMFPNVFWGTFNDFLDKPRPIAILSASCQNSAYNLFTDSIMISMNKYIKHYSYISTRDDWTRDMYKHITKGKIVPEVTPDPVFAFNYNISYLPSKDGILRKFNLPENYLLFAFFNNHKVSVNWLNEIQKLANSDSVECVSLSFPEGDCYNHPFKRVINIPLNPIDWYCLIKYSQGYIGHNMHPIVVCLHNSVPFFSFDNYGVAKLRTFVNEKSSKIYHILSLAGFLENRICDVNLFKKVPSAQYVYGQIRKFDKDKCTLFAKEYYAKYQKMMSDIISNLNKDSNG